MATDRIVTAHAQGEPDEAHNWSLRPDTLDEFVGQPDLVSRLRIAIDAAKERGEHLEHVLLHGPPGLGKTTVAHIVAKEMGARAYVASGPALTRGADLVGALTRLEQTDIFFIDEIHRLPPAVEEFIYSAMEDFRIDIPVDSGMHSRTVAIRLKPFTLVGATTRAGLLTAALRSRFGVSHHLRYYDPGDLLAILVRSASLLGLRANEEALCDVATRSRGAPRVANRLLRRVRDYAQVKSAGVVTLETVHASLSLEGVDRLGLDELDRAYMRTLATTYKGGPAGLEAIAATMNEDAGALEAVVEPYLLQIGFLARTRRGRLLTHEGANHIGADPPQSVIEASREPEPLFADDD